MLLFHQLQEYGCESLHVTNDAASGLEALIAIHSTRRGPAFGGIRTLTYKTQNAAITHALRLSQAMSRKAAVADLPVGGGKAVVINKPALNRQAVFHALGREIEKLGGTFFTGLDVGTTREDLHAVAEKTKYVARDLDFGRATARGVLAAIRAALQHHFDDDDLQGRTVAVQGLGGVGMELAMMLSEAGAELFIADTNETRAAEIGEQLGCEVVSAARVLAANVDVLCPCALGAVFTERNVPSLRCAIIAGSANNQLLKPVVANELMDAGIVWVPDFVANAGALIKGVREHLAGKEVGFEVVDQIQQTTLSVLQRAEGEGKPTLEIAEAIARERLS
jgi:leucine dehydrogenase